MKVWPRAEVKFLRATPQLLMLAGTPKTSAAGAIANENSKIADLGSAASAIGVKASIGNYSSNDANSQEETQYRPSSSSLANH